MHHRNFRPLRLVVGGFDVAREMRGYLASRKLALQAIHAIRFGRRSIGLGPVVTRGLDLGDSEAPSALWVLDS